LLATFLPDIGKARIPKEILTSTKRFESDGSEMREIRKHPALRADLLSRAGMPEVIVNMAHYHHVKLDETMTSSYPEGIT
jgi:HD-GYP domain-containing protein (c-di-GMP phosphodiesterase class II)